MLIIARTTGVLRRRILFPVQWLSTTSLLTCMVPQLCEPKLSTMRPSISGVNAFAYMYMLEL